jgi:hypothetical protein
MNLLERLTVVLIAASLAFVTGVGSTDAARQPMFKEREALTLALPASFRRYPIGCVWLSKSVSNNGRYAIVAPGFLKSEVAGELPMSADQLPALRGLSFLARYARESMTLL